MKLDSDIAIRQYYDKVKHLYPHVDFEEFKLACKSEFEYTKEQMASGELPVVRLKYFGTFIVYPKRAEAFLRRLKERFKFRKVNKDYFFRMRDMVETFLAKHESKS